jgi:hypothetical protein
MCEKPTVDISVNICALNCLCGLVVRVPGYRSTGPDVQFLALPNFSEKCWVWEWDPCSLVRIIEELLE